ncbi:hypothetical protein KFL_000400080 [Klebsormidium nitens]|uniref:Uncharacterized protein n=1 Tax=Klebsormidium nitens TaxID=105231 RepID=A0A1Y1HML5_KLENI|nr:hypothetical protein KFL_000400080 [Klebsormidium nitens]|eukprot:GAQ79865.1 hypothetical protein KFL_000400080 [Klebsormidium nitens]
MASQRAFVQALVLGALLFFTGPAAAARALEDDGSAELKEDAFQPLFSITSENEVPEEDIAVSASNSNFVANGGSQSVCQTICKNEVKVNFFSEATGYKSSLDFDFFYSPGGEKCSNDGIWCVRLRSFDGGAAKVSAQFRYGGRTSSWVTLRGKAKCGSTGTPQRETCRATFKDAFFNF